MQKADEGLGTLGPNKDDIDKDKKTDGSNVTLPSKEVESDKVSETETKCK